MTNFIGKPSHHIDISKLLLKLKVTRRRELIDIEGSSTYAI